MDLYERVLEAAESVRKASAEAPRVGVVLGSGLGEFADRVAGRTAVAFTDIPHFRAATVDGHAARLVLGRVGGVPVAVLQGRIHYYEGHEIADVVFPVRVLAKLGAESLLLTNAAGGIRPSFRPGDLMIIRDHINLTGTNPLRGVNDTRLGPRFPDMSAAYDPEFQESLAAALEEIGRPPLRGVYAGLAGPSYETPAEIRMLSVLGADAVGMSTVAEAICARQMGLRLAGLSCITNPAAGLSARPLDHKDVLETGRAVKADIVRLLELVVPRLA
jgi:purine-nucleoside phosphorylase